MPKIQLNIVLINLCSIENANGKRINFCSSQKEQMKLMSTISDGIIQRIYISFEFGKSQRIPFTFGIYLVNEIKSFSLEIILIKIRKLNSFQ